MDATLTPRPSVPVLPANGPAGNPGGKPIQREVAHRVFAAEFNASRAQIPGAGEKDPSFVVTPLGAKVNRLHIVGVCTDIEPVGESGEVWRARVSDPTGIFTVYAGNYQPEAAHALSQIQPPQFVAVTGKARVYEPEPGSVFVSVRPESITIVDQPTRDQWVLDTARRTQERLKATRELKANPQATAEALAAKGHPRATAEGALLAQQHYGLGDIERYGTMMRNALEHMAGGTTPVHRLEPRGTPTLGNLPQDSPLANTEPAGTAPAWKPPTPPPGKAEADAAQEELDAKVLASVQKMEGQKGARWDDILNATATGGITAEDVEESLNRLMDKGLVYEPTLGILKTT